MSKIKRLVSLGLVFLMSINSFATSISDNDGSSFITKAEFDALKSSFQSQIDTYNQNIDSKIDNAIAAYLAGISISTEKRENYNISGLEYPLTIIGHDKDIDNLTANHTSHDVDSLWDYDWTFYAGASRGTDAAQAAAFTAKDTYSQEYYKGGSYDNFQPASSLYPSSGVTLTFEKLLYQPTKLVTTFLDGGRNGDYFDVTGLTLDPKIELQTAAIHENFFTALMFYNDVVSGVSPTWDAYREANGGVYTTFSLDASNATKMMYSSGSSIWTNIGGKYYLNTAPLASYAWLGSTATWTPTTIWWDYSHHATYKIQASTMCDAYDDEKKYDYKRYDDGTRQNWWRNSGVTEEPIAKDLAQSTYTYNTAPLNIIYNHSTGTTGFQAPVTYNRNLYFTNKKWNRKMVTPNARQLWTGRMDPKSTAFGVVAVITTGCNLESEAETGSTHSWYNRSCISQDRLRWTWTDNEGNTGKQFMTKGIPIFKVSGDCEEFAIDISITSQTGKSSNPKYILISKAPIAAQDYSANYESNTSYLQIKDGTTSKVRKKKLAEGSNTLMIMDDINDDDLIYIKILWDDSNDEFMTLGAPAITYKQKQ